MQVRLAQEFAARGVVGVDLSGNPTVGAWETWRPALETARQVCSPATAFPPTRAAMLCR